MGIMEVPKIQLLDDVGVVRLVMGKGEDQLWHPGGDGLGRRSDPPVVDHQTRFSKQRTQRGPLANKNPLRNPAPF